MEAARAAARVAQGKGRRAAPEELKLTSHREAAPVAARAKMGGRKLLQKEDITAQASPRPTAPSHIPLRSLTGVGWRVKWAAVSGLVVLGLVLHVLLTTTPAQKPCPTAKDLLGGLSGSPIAEHVEKLAEKAAAEAQAPADIAAHDGELERAGEELQLPRAKLCEAFLCTGRDAQSLPFRACTEAAGATGAASPPPPPPPPPPPAADAVGAR
ncbi:hypothetical protein T484DRAFT_1818906 [Baffinella frigidus]|nr:hypothetical protein T484DRAFT_1818906 [Cryptophyta sp. CCMP2293]